MVKKNLKDCILFLGCEFVCFSLLGLLHQAVLKDDLRIMAFYDEHYSYIPYSITVLVPVLFGLSFILFFYYLIGSVNLLAPFVPIIIALIFIYRAITNMELTAFNDYFMHTYGPYLLILAALWGFVFFLHKKIKSSEPKEENKKTV